MKNKTNKLMLCLAIYSYASMSACAGAARQALINDAKSKSWHVLVSDGEPYFLDPIAQTIVSSGLRPDPNYSHRTGSFNPDGTKFVYTYEWNAIGLFDAKTGTAQTLFTEPHIDDVKWSPKGSAIAFAGRSSTTEKDDLCLYNLADSKTNVIVDKSIRPSYGRFSWSPDGLSIVYEDSDSIVWIVDINTKERRKLDTGTSPTWSPNGRYISYESVDSNNKLPGFIIRDLQTGKTQQILKGQNILSGLIWSPDSKYVLFSRLSRGVLATWVGLHGDEYWGDLYILDLNSQAEIKVYGHGSTIMPLDWKGYQGATEMVSHRR